MESRASILNALRAARPSGSGSALPACSSADVFADYPAASTDLFSAFRQKIESLRGETLRCSSLSEAANALVALLPSGVSYAYQEDTRLKELLAQHDLAAHLGEGISAEATRLESKAFAQLTVGFSLADALVARTGSIVLRATRAGGRRLSVLPEVHVVLASSKQLVPSLEDWLKVVSTDPDWSYAGLITGPSRTADIERIIVFGAHGPRRLIVVLIDQN